MRRHLLLALTLCVGCEGAPSADAGGRDAAGRDGGDLGVDAAWIDAGTDAGLPPLRDDAVDPPFRWDEQARRLIDSTTLAERYVANGYALPAGASVYAVRVVDGVGQPGYELYEAGGGAFTLDFWPASTIKLLSSVAALEFAGARGFTGAARMSWDSGYNDILASIYDRAIRDSSNPDYDRTLRVSGLDWLNSEFLTPERGFPSVVITSPYGGLPVRDIPGLTMSEGTRSDYTPARGTTGDYGRNDANLFELVEGLRRVLQHAEIPEAHRFALADADLAGLRDALCGSTVKYFRSGVGAVLGADASICNKYGLVPSADCLDHAMVQTADGSERFFIAAVIPAGSCDARLGQIAEQTLLAIRDAPEATPLALDAGVPIVVQVDDLGSDGVTRQVRLTIDAPGADRVLSSVDAEGAREVVGASRFALERSTAGGDHLLIVRAFAGAAQVGYRALRVRFPAP